MTDLDQSQAKTQTIRLTSLSKKKPADFSLSAKGLVLHAEDGRVVSIPDLNQFHSQLIFIGVKPEATLMVRPWKEAFRIPNDLFQKIMLHFGPEAFIRADLRQMLKQGVLLPIALFGINAYDMFSQGLVNATNGVVLGLSFTHLLISLWGSLNPQIWLLRGLIVLNAIYASLFCFIAYDRGWWALYLLSAFMVFAALGMSGRVNILEKVRAIQVDHDQSKR